MVVDIDLQCPAGVYDLLGHVDIRPRGGGIARGVVVQQDDVAARQFQGAAHHLARIDRRVIDRAAVQDLIGDQLVLLVEKQHPELFARLIGQGDADIGQQGAPG